MAASLFRANLPSCTQKMVEVMQRLRECENKSIPFPSLEDVHGRTIWSLMKRNWIMCISLSELQPIYRITKRGLKALSIYEIPPAEYDQRRYDGICCRCETNERGYYSTGTMKPYCDDCLKKIAARKFELFGYQKNPGICPKCQKREKHITASGNVRSYCQPCRRKLSKRLRKRRNKSLVKRARKGEVFICYRCKERPRQLTANTLQDYCYECLVEYRCERKEVSR